MTSKLVHRRDRDADLVARVYKRAEKRRRADQREQGRQRLRDRIGIIERPPQNFRERCRGVVEEEERQPDFIDALRERRKERERAERVRHA